MANRVLASTSARDIIARLPVRRYFSSPHRLEAAVTAYCVVFRIGKMTGSSRWPQLMDSWNTPSLLAPSPEKATAIVIACSLLPKAAPTAVGMDERGSRLPKNADAEVRQVHGATLPYKSRCCFAKKAQPCFCYLTTLGIGWPLRAVVAGHIVSSRRARQAPTATASSPMLRNAPPRQSHPRSASRSDLSSKRRMSSMRPQHSISTL